jgi:hypothetical protein
LAFDIQANGLHVPIELLDGKIVDGRRRYLAFQRLGAAPQFKTVTVDDPIGYVLSLNSHRRHLTPAQRSMCAARAKKLRRRYEAEAKKRQKAAGGDRRSGKSVQEHVPEPKGVQARDELGKAFGVSGRSMRAAWPSPLRRYCPRSQWKFNAKKRQSRSAHGIIAPPASRQAPGGSQRRGN